MVELALGVIAVPALDLGVKRVLDARGGRASLGRLGEVRPRRAPIWLARARRPPGLRAMWLLWSLGAAASVVASAWLPGAAWGLGLLVGGAAAHAIETTGHGSVCDYVCLRFWPAFDMADVAMASGTIGVLRALAGALP